ncbi:MAG: beta-eliminating lyase-related protein [Bdellovibrionales bacterium]
MSTSAEHQNMFLGSKLIPVRSYQGKIDLKHAEQFCIRKGDQHYAQPGVLSITQPTEVGTCYSLEELSQIREFCDRHQLKLHIDGARFCYAPQYLQWCRKIIDSQSPSHCC